MRKASAKILCTLAVIAFPCLSFRNFSGKDVRAKTNVKSIRNECKSYTFSEDSLDIRKSLEKLGLILGEKIDEGSSAFIYLAISTGLSGFGKVVGKEKKGKFTQ